MEKDRLFAARKEIKKKGHSIVRGHYFVLIFLTLLLILFGSEFNYSKSPWKATTQPIENAIIKQGQKAGMLGTSRGVLAKIIQSKGSDDLFFVLGRTIQLLTGGHIKGSSVSVILGFLWYLFLFTFVINIYSAALRRVYLEARTYQQVPMMNVLYFAGVKQWFHASKVMLTTYVMNMLWYLTIIGGFIKSYSYWAVPYIVAENPSLSSIETITLSRKMMNGYKLEVLKVELSFLGWYLLAMVTGGISDMLYGASYRLSCYAEMYARIRESAIRNGIEGAENLNDRYLFEPADRISLYETYFKVVDEITLLHENKYELTGIQKLMADGPGIWVGSIENKRAFERQEGYKHSLQRYKDEMVGLIYPELLSPLYHEKKEIAVKNVSYLKSYTLWDLFLIFIVISFIGWSWEVALHLATSGNLVNRGTLHGPWLPIYGSGAVIVMVVCNYYRKNPVAEFFSAIALCGFLEYMSGWYLETHFHQKWWSYKGYFLNLHGRICAEGLLLFGVGCCFIVYILAPVLEYAFSRLKKKVMIAICLILLVIFAADAAYSHYHPNKSEGKASVQVLEHLSST